MKLDLNIQEPILVKNPNTGRHVNVAPLFDAMAQIGESGPESPESLRKAVTKAIRAINLAWDEASDATERKDVNVDLYLLEDMFAAMAEFNQGK